MGQVVLKNVYKEYEKGIQAVSDFSFETANNEFVGACRSIGLRKIHHPAHDSGTRSYYERRDIYRRAAR